MAITEFTCPECGVTARSAKELAAGTQVRCPKCSHVFKLPSSNGQPAATKITTKSTVIAKPSPSKQGIENKPRRPKDDEVNQRPKSRARRDDDDYDDDDDRPRRKKRKPEKKGSNAVMWIAGGLAALVLIGGGVAVGVFAFGGKKDQTTQVAQQPTQPVRPTPGNPGNPSQPGTTPDNSGSSAKDPVISDATPGATSSSAESLPDSRPIGEAPPKRSNEPPPPPPVAVNGSLPPDVLTKVKKATVYIRCYIKDGVAMGSGFFCGGGRDIVFTNAHVVNQLHLGDEVPRQLDVVLNSGQDDETVCKGQILAVDRFSDLAVVKITPTGQGKAPFPDPLKIEFSSNLHETQQVFACGFPLGESLGKAITISPTAVSSLRRDVDGNMDEVQITGGITHGNSGGPLIDAAGNVVGVSVRGRKETENINFCVPSERVLALLNGKLTNIIIGDAARSSGGQMKVSVEVETLDPLKRIGSINVDWWWGDPKDKVAAARDKAPAQPAGASERQSVAMKQAKEANKFTAEIMLPSGPPPSGKVMWLQPRFVNSEKEAIYVRGISKEIDSPPEARAALVKFRQRIERAIVNVNSTDHFSFRTKDGDLHTVGLKLESRMTEDTQEGLPDGSAKVVVHFDTFDAAIIADGKRREDPLMKLILKDATKLSIQMIVDRTGSVVKAEPNLVNVPPTSRDAMVQFSDQVQNAMDYSSITFPNTTVKPNQTWQGERNLPFELPVPEGLVSVGIKMLVSYTFVGVRKVNGVDHAVIAVKGSFPSTRIPVQLGNRGAGPGPGPGPGPGQFPGRPGGGGAEGSITMGGTARGTAIVDLSKNRVAKVNMVLDSKIDISVPAMKLDLGLHDRHEFKMTRESDDRR